MIKTIATVPNYFRSVLKSTQLISIFIFFTIPSIGQDPILSGFKDTLEIKPLLEPILYDSIYKPVLSIDSIYILKAKKYNLKNEIRNLIVVPDLRINTRQNSYTVSYEHSVSQFLPYSDKTIRKIQYQQLEVLGQSIQDPNEKPDSWFEKLINALHIKTQKNIIKNNLIFNSGDKIDPAVLADNERIIRKMPNIQDVRIIPQDIGSTNDSVDLLIVTKDVLPIGFGIEFFDLNKGQTGIWSKNLLGIGHEMYYYLLWDIRSLPIYGHKIRYRINNISNTFISADATYENNWNAESYKLYFNRDFYTPETKKAGGAGFEKNRLLKDIYLHDTMYIDQIVDFTYADIWIGRSLKIRKYKNNLTRQNIALTGRAYNYSFRRRPSMVNETNLYNLHSRTTILLALGLTRQAYIKTQYLYGFGRPEDVPYGSKLNITGGYELNEYSNRYYGAVQFASGYYFPRFGYIYQNTEIGSFFSNKPEQGAIKLNAKYFTPLLNSSGRYRHRVFTDFNYVRGINRNDDEYIELSPREGIRGLSSESLHGNERYYFNIEYDCYLPHKIYGFRLTYFMFLDAGAITRYSDLLNSPLYSGFGGGIKIRNENLVFNTIFIRFGYYPRLPDPRVVRYYEFYGRPITEYPTFENSKPEIVKFQN